MIALVYSPFPTFSAAKKVGQQVIKDRLAACVNILRSESMYEWKGRSESGKEYVLIAKTSLKKEKALIEAIKRNHPYTLPAILSWKVKANRNYEEWVFGQVGSKV